MHVTELVIVTWLRLGHNIPPGERSGEGVEELKGHTVYKPHYDLGLEDQ